MLCRSPDWGMRGGMQRDRALALYIHKKRLLRSFLTHRNLVNVILLVFILLYTNKIAVIAPCKRNRIETKSVF